MRHGRSIAILWTGALLLSAAAIAEPRLPPIQLIAPAPNAAAAVEAVAAALRANDPDKAERLANLALDRDDLAPAQEIHVLLNRGLARERQGKRDGALADFSEALKDPHLARETRARALFDRGIVQDELGQIDKAVADYGAALKLVPDFPAALNNRANAYRRLGRLELARQGYLASLAAGNKQPQYPTYGLGRIAEARGELAVARNYYRQAASYEEALAADPHYALARERLALLAKRWPKARAAAPKHRPAPPPTQVAAVEPHAAAIPVSDDADSGVPALRPAILGASSSHPHAGVQLGAYRAKADASSGWHHLLGRARGLLGGLTPKIVAVDLPGRGRFWRLRAGPLAHDDADALCAQLKARGLACMPVKS